MVLLFTTLIVGLVVLFLISRDMLTMGTEQMDPSSFLFSLILVSVLIGAVIAFFTLRYPINPIYKLLNAMNQLASGDYSVRLSFKGIFSRHPTVVQFTDSFNKMASELQQTEMLREDFINNFSHEFKTPIVSIAGFAKVLKRGNLTKERHDEFLDIIEEESLRLSQMATNVLNLTRVENQSILTDVVRLNLSEQIRTCVLVLENKWSKKNIEFSLPDQEYFISGNDELLKQVWINLIDNAVKFSKDGGTVEVDIRSGADGMTVDISNFGEEIPEDAREKIFRKFYQTDESHATEGNGVGLAVVKKIIDLHRGTISVDCLNGRTTFSVSIPSGLQ